MKEQSTQRLALVAATVSMLRRRYVRAGKLQIRDSSTELRRRS
jgi:hypothetical protein